MCWQTNLIISIWRYNRNVGKKWLKHRKNYRRNHQRLLYTCTCRVPQGSSPDYYLQHWRFLDCVIFLCWRGFHRNPTGYSSHTASSGKITCTGKTGTEQTSTVYVEIYAGTFFLGFKDAKVYACTNIRRSTPDSLLYPCITCLRWYLHSRSEDDRVNSANWYTANISTYTVNHSESVS